MKNAAALLDYHDLAQTSTVEKPHMLCILRLSADHVVDAKLSESNPEQQSINSFLRGCFFQRILISLPRPGKAKVA